MDESLKVENQGQKAQEFAERFERYKNLQEKKDLQGVRSNPD